MGNRIFSAMGNYKTQHERSLAEPSAYWLELAKDVHWYTSPKQGVDTSQSPFNSWFADGEINACYNAIDAHVDSGRGQQLAIIHDSPITDSHTTYTYDQLLDLTSRFAGVLRAEGVEKGDRVMIYMPMIPEAVIAILACARIGAMHSVVFGGFAAKELAVRIDDCTPDVIVTASCGIEPGRIVEYQPLVEDAIDIASSSVSTCIVYQRTQADWQLKKGRDKDWATAMTAAKSTDCVPLKSTDPLYILYTSGTTGAPKGVVKDVGGTVVSLKWTMSSIYNVQPGDVYWAASDIGWVVGHSYIIYGPLFHGCTGERCDPDTLKWAEDTLKVPVIDHWWQTETGYSICANCQGIEAMPIVPGSPSVAVPGYDVRVLDNDGDSVEPGEIGSIVVKLPLPPGTFTTLWNARERYLSAYFERFPGFYETGDAGYIDENGFVFVMARTDDVINVAGHRLSTGGMEEVLANHPDVAECAVMGVNDELKGQLPVGLVILNSGTQKNSDEICKELIQKVREDIGPVAAFKSVAVVEKLPKTRSGKILRGTLRSIADSKSWNMPATIEDPSVLDDITQTLKAMGFAKDAS